MADQALAGTVEHIPNLWSGEPVPSCNGAADPQRGGTGSTRHPALHIAIRLP